MNIEKKRYWICGTSGAIVFACLCVCPANVLPEPWNSLLAVAGIVSALAYCLYL